MKTFLAAVLTSFATSTGTTWSPRAWLFQAIDVDAARGMAVERFLVGDRALHTVDVKEVTEIAGWVPDDGVLDEEGNKIGARKLSDLLASRDAFLAGKGLFSEYAAVADEIARGRK